MADPLDVHELKSKKCKRLVIQGLTSSSIQGINLREQVEEFVRRKFNITSKKAVGKITNLKSGEVEIIFCYSKRSDLDQLMKYLHKIDGVRHVDPYDYENDQEFTDFRVERSDDLSEMVWALKGAGTRFKDATDTLEKINNTIEERDKQAAIGRLLALYFELIHNRRLLRTTIRKNRDKINTVALEANIEKPAISEREFIYLTNEVYSDFADYREGVRLSVKDLSKKVEALIRTIINELSIRGEQV